MLWALILLVFALLAGLAVLAYAAFPARERPLPTRAEMRASVRGRGGPPARPPRAHPVRPHASLRH